MLGLISRIIGMVLGTWISYNVGVALMKDNMSDLTVCFLAIVIICVSIYYAASRFIEYVVGAFIEIHTQTKK